MPEQELPAVPRSLSPREGAVMGWIEAERRRVVTPDDLAEVFDWPRQAIWDVLRGLAAKGWLRRTVRGSYETVLAETGGFAPPNPWAALSTWRQEHYVGFQSAAYELGLIPDRPGDVQVCVPVGAHRPEGWSEVPVSLVPLRSFSLEGVEDRELHGWRIAVATPEKIVVEAAAVQDRVGGALGLARLVSRAVDQVNWDRVVELSQGLTYGRAVARRLGALLDVLGLPIPGALARYAGAPGRTREIMLGNPARHGDDGTKLERWNVLVNVDPEILREEVRR